jgi:hypothetical protein
MQEMATEIPMVSGYFEQRTLSRADTAQLRSMFENLGNPEKVQLVEGLLEKIGTEGDDYNTAGRRDMAVEMLRLVSLEEYPDKPGLMRKYLDVVKGLTDLSNPWGSMQALLEAGEIVAGYFPKSMHSRNEVADVLDGKLKSFETQTQEKHALSHLRAAVLEMIPIPQNANEQEELGYRELPRLDDPEKQLHDLYLEETSEGRSFKKTLWENTREFRELAAGYNIDIAQFWNVSDPNTVVAAIATFEDETRDDLLAAAQMSLTKHCRNRLGQDVVEFSQEERCFLADEIVQAAHFAVVELRKPGQEVEEVLSRFRQLVREAQNGTFKKVNRTFQQITAFFRKYGVVVEEESTEAIQGILNDQNKLKVLGEYYDQEQQRRAAAADLIETTFGTAVLQEGIRTSPRDRDEMFAGDETADCTAYHLQTGVNAWTMPVWLSNPGFTFVRFADESNNMVAKLGVVLSVADGRPALTVDSFEVSKGIDGEEDAKSAIRKGFLKLSDWARKVGIEEHDIYINTICNSTEAVTLLEQYTSSAEVPVGELVAMGGLNGVAELRKNLYGTEVVERIYLQSNEVEELDQVQREEEARRRAAYVSSIESTINSVLTSNAITESEKEKFLKYARGQDWSGLFGLLMKYKFANVAGKLGGEWSDYEEIFERYVVDPANNVTEPREITKAIERVISEAIETSDLDEDVSMLRLDDPEEAGRLNSFDELTDEELVFLLDTNAEHLTEILYKEAEELDELLAEIKEMQAIGFPVEAALKKLYADTRETKGEGDKMKLVLDPKLRVLRADI